HRESTLYVADGTIDLKETRTISGYAGDVTLHSHERFTAPDTDTVLRYDKDEVREDGALHQTEETGRRVDVHRDGSTSVKEGDQPEVVEPGVLLIASR